MKQAIYMMLAVFALFTTTLHVEPSNVSNDNTPENHGQSW